MSTKNEKDNSDKITIIKNLGFKILKEIESGQNPFLDIPVRAFSNVHYNETKKVIELGSATSKRYFFNVSHIRKFVQTAEVANLAIKLLNIDKHLSLRQVFYAMRRTIPNTKIDIVDEQTESNQAIEDLELITGLPREQFNVNAKKSGAAAGKIVIEDKEDIIDLSKMGSGGWSIPSNTENLKFKKVDAKYVIYMEKDTMWERLNEDRFWDKNNCVIIASQGQATRGIRRLLKRLSEEYKLPIYVLVDFDPWGFYIYSVLKFGSIDLANFSDKLAITEAKFLGMSAEDIKKYDLEKQKIKFKDVDQKRLEQIKNYDWFKNDKRWQNQFEQMGKMSSKVELDALITRGIAFVSEKYLPEKIKNKDWID